MIITAAQKTRTGIFVLISLLLLVAVIVLIGKQKNLFGDTFLVYANFKNIAGAKEGNYVRFAGINVGTVQTISLINDTTVQLALNLENKIRPYVKKDAIASIGSDGLMGDKLILIAPGHDSMPVVKNGDRLLSSNPLDMDKIMNNLSKISNNASVLTEGLSDIVSKINQGKGSIGRLLANDNLAKKMENTVTTAGETAASFKAAANNVNENLDAVKHNFLLRGYFKRKEKKRIKDSTENANKEIQTIKDKKTPPTEKDNSKKINQKSTDN